ncbi:alpha/beta fold hydrolase [Williamsia sp. MIQD14]|uniref:alpha/beta fold hydrolase n=1 Tax=Williamsia sp. MIQD14 TaxID=3425703 RepID=UPI003DA1437E
MLTASATDVPHAVAIVGRDGQITYADLLERASQAASVLAGAGRGAVAIGLDDRIEPLVTAFGALIAGRALVPLDPQLTAERVTRILALADAELADAERIGDALEGASISPPSAQPTDVATIVFTSGSTGEPKGVVFDHENAVGKAYEAVVGQRLTHGDRIADVLPLGFSAGLTTLFSGLLAGATVLLADARRMGVETLMDWLHDQRPTAINSSVSLVRRLAAGVRDGAHAPLPSVRQITFYGEPSTREDVLLARHLAEPAPRVVNWYGATEVGLVGHTVIDPDDEVPPGRVAAGRGLPGLRQVTIVDDGGHALPAGGVGEVIVVGGTIAVGYANRSSDRFLPDAGSGRGYRTGDRGFLDPDGTLHILGRADDAVKIRGYLVEPAEIEVAITAMSNVDEAFVRGVETDGGTELVAYVGSTTVTSGELEQQVRTRVAGTLAPWMVPRFVVGMAALPRTDRGKVDRAALPPPTALPPLSAPPGRRRRRRAPDVVESAVRLALTRASVPGDLDADQDLVAAGVDSLMLARITSTLRQMLHVEVDLAVFIASPTIATLTRVVREANSDATRRAGGGGGVLVPLRTEGVDTPLALVAGAGAPASAFIPLVRALAPGRRIVGLQARGLEQPGRPDRTVVAMASRNIEHLRTVQPRGPYHLAGHSMGGLVALEMAAQLAADGESVEHVVLIDSALTFASIAELDVASPPADDVIHFDAEGPEQVEMTMTHRQLVGLFLRLPVAGRKVFDPVTQWIVFYHRGVRMLRRHRVRRIDAPVTVLCAQGSTHQRSWWESVTSGQVHLVAVPGGHVDVLHAPHVAAVARVIDAALRD